MFSTLRYHLDFAKNEARNMVLQVLASAPASPVQGQGYYDSALLATRWYDGSAWTNKATDSALLNGQNAAFYLARANHTGTQTASTISDFASVAQSYRLDQFTAPNVALSIGSQRLINVADPSGAQDAATKNYVDTQMSNAAAGIDPKASVRLVATASVALTGLQTIDSVAGAASDRILLTAQTTASQNGVYLMQSGAWTRALDADTSAEITPGAFWYIEEGTTNGASQWRCSNIGAITLGTTSITIVQFGGAAAYTASLGVQKVSNDFRAQVVASGGVQAVAGGLQIDTAIVVRGASALVGTGASATAAFAHNLNTTKVNITVNDASTGELVGIKTVITDANTVTITSSATIASNALRITVMGIA